MTGPAGREGRKFLSVSYQPEVIGHQDEWNGNGALEFSENRGVTRKEKEASQEGEALEG